MFSRLWGAFAVLTTALILATAPAACATPKPPPKAHRVVAIGDLHGDFAAWRDITVAAHLLDAQGHWVGGDTVLVQTGDVVDRGPDSLKIIADLMRLQQEARRSGGRVIALVGNHEAMNMTNDLRYVSAGEYAAFVTPKSAALREQTYAANRVAIEGGYRQRDPTMSPSAIKQAWLAATPLGQLEHQAAWRPTGKIGRWVMANPAVAVVDGTLFVHGGISAAYGGMPVPEINSRVAAALKARETADSSIINDQAGPLWYRGLVLRDPPGQPATGDGEAAPSPAATAPALTIEEELDQVLKAQGVKRMVIGHTPILSGVAVLYDGRLVRIDTGISAYYKGRLGYLEIVDGVLIPQAAARSTPLPGSN